MRYGMIMAGGSGTRLWPMSRGETPKQLIPFIDGRSLIQIAMARLEGLVPVERTWVCAGESHRTAILKALPQLSEDRYLGEPMGRDTLNAVGLAAAVIAQQDPDAVIAVFTADHIIEPVDRFQAVVNAGFEIAEQHDSTLVTFGVTPTHAATAYGYLALGEAIGDGGARVVEQFKEKPDAATAEQYVDAGPSRYLWNSGMFVWKASVLLEAIKQYAPGNYQGLITIGQAWATPQRADVLSKQYPTLDKISVDFAVMEPASKDPAFQVAAVPMPLSWLDVGSWPAFAQTRPTDEAGNALAAKQHVLMDSRGCLVASDDPEHLIATIGLDDVIVVHTERATLVCHKDRAEDIKKLHASLGKEWV